ncbi:DUF3043 domain-containing protein [Sediminivirga luteola]|uniref:DUF3043 domain-containing protein n=1 Tax=Sediminivirga luteola TaxID=1774748 RepID=UPI001F568FEF|nr:DUF3043 domain-containing protein [Sediminivirga luteola]
MFGRKKDQEEAAVAPVDGAVTPAAVSEEERRAAEQKKNRPTPTRKEREAARKQPLAQPRRKPRTKEDKERLRTERERARIGLMNGEERYLGPRDRGPQRRFVRDWVDARFSIGEVFIPVALLILIVGMFNNVQVQIAANVTVYGLVLLLVVDGFLMSRALKKRLREKFGEDSLERGLTFYAVMRALQMRRFRVPKPQVKRGAYPG